MAVEIRTQTINSEQTFAVFNDGTLIGVFSYLDNARGLASYLDTALKRGETAEQAVYKYFQANGCDAFR